MTTAPPQMEKTSPPPEEPSAGAALSAGTSNVRELFSRNLRQSGIYIAFVVIVALFAVLTDGLSLNPTNVTNIVLQYSYVLILAIGMVIVIIAGHIDLSVGSVVALTGAVSAVLVIRDGWPWWGGILAALVTGVLIGCWQGFWVAYVGIPAFIVTLASMLLFRGLTLVVLKGATVGSLPQGF
ncbi:MAG TPA: sugar ABC transporter permease, partial [Kribbella sp.]